MKKWLIIFVSCLYLMQSMFVTAFVLVLYGDVIVVDTKYFIFAGFALMAL